jgi:hypothetical protein
MLANGRTVLQIQVIVESVVRTNGPVFVPSPLNGALPVPVHPIHQLVVPPLTTGELVTEAVIV